MKKLKLHISELLMLCVALIWGLNFALIKLSIGEIPPMPFNGIRLPLASLILLIWLRVSKENLKVKKEHIFKIILLALAGHTVYQYIFIQGINLTTASNTAVLFGAVPILISLFSSFFKYEKIKPLGWLGIAAAFVGVYIVISGKSGGFSLSLENLKGDALILLAVILWAYYSVASKPLLKVYSPLKFTTLTLSIGSFLFFPFTVKELVALPFSSISAVAWICLAASGILALSVALIIWFFSISKVGNSKTAVYSNLSPVFAVVFAFFILAEDIRYTLIIGAAVILAGIFFTHLSKPPAGGQTFEKV